MKYYEKVKFKLYGKLGCNSLNVMDHPEMPEWINDMAKEIHSVPLGQIRCRGCNEMVPINGKFLDILVMRGVSSIERCTICRGKHGN